MKRAIAPLLAMVTAACAFGPALVTTDSQSFAPINASTAQPELALDVHPNLLLVTWDTAGPLPGASDRLPQAIAEVVNTFDITVQAIGANYAVLAMGDTANSVEQVALRQLPQVTAVQPVLRQPGISQTSVDEGMAIAPTGEIVVRFEERLSDAERQALLDQSGLELVRPLRFTESTYLVRGQERAEISASAVQDAQHLWQKAAVLQNQPGVVAANPNLMQLKSDVASPLGMAGDDMTAAIAPHPQSLLAQAWHLDSRLYRQENERTDIRAIDAWDISQQGEGTTVAVIDSTLQWDHPDLVNQIACLENPLEALLPGEVCGYDFVEDDGDTRLSTPERAVVRSLIQDSFQLSDAELLDAYAHWTSGLGDLSEAEQARTIRQWLQKNIQAIFHGTWSAGVIAANSPMGNGLRGVAPHAKILPVRVFDLAGSTTTATLMEAIGYAAARDVDVINLSLGGPTPDPVLTAHVQDLLEADPNLVIVASAGNNNQNEVAFPASIPGVLAVGATNLEGQRAPYSQFGNQLDLVAPGGDLSEGAIGGILTTGGTGLASLWSGLPQPQQPWGYGFDPLGRYVRVEGTSFSAPNVSGIVALMRGEAPTLDRAALIQILLETASTEHLNLSPMDEAFFQQLGFTDSSSAEVYFFGAGLVNAEAAVAVAQNME